MSNDLLYHYEKELAFLKERADEFAKQHPVVAEGLRLEPNSIEDPLVKQLLSGVAFLNARVQQKISDGFPELTNAILETMRSEEHTSELQSRPHLVCRLLLEK